MGEAQTATRPGGNCAVKGAERLIHTSAKASVQTDALSRLSGKITKIHARSNQNRSQLGPWGVLAAFRCSKVTQERPKAPQKRPQEGPRAPLSIPKGTPRATKGPQRVPGERPKAIPRDLRKGKSEEKWVTEAKKVDFGKSAPRLGPADARSTSDPLESLKNRVRMVQSRFLEHP